MILSLQSGCTSLSEYIHNGFKVGPNDSPAAVRVADNWIDAGDKRIRLDEQEPSNWWTIFHDPILDGLVADVYGQNLTLREAGFRVLEARAKYGIAVGGLFPQTQAASGSFTQINVSRNNANVPPTIKTAFGQWDLGFGLAWELDFSGRFRRAIESAGAELDASVDNYDDVLVTLIADTAAAYAQLRILQQQLNYAQANIALQQKTFALAEAQFKGGKRRSSTRSKPQRTGANRSDHSPVAYRDPHDDRPTLLTVKHPARKTYKVNYVPLPFRRQRPISSSAFRQISYAGARCPPCRKSCQSPIGPDRYCRSGLLSELIHFRQPSDGKLRSSRTYSRRALSVGNVGPSFQSALLNYGRIYNNVVAQDAQFQAAVTSYQNSVLKADKEVEDGLVNFLESQQQNVLLAKSVAAAEKAVNIALAQYTGGTTDFNRVALLEQNLVGQQNQLAQLQGQSALGLIQVYRALGGGWQIRLSDPSPIATVTASPAGHSLAAKLGPPRVSSEPRP